MTDWQPPLDWNISLCLTSKFTIQTEIPTEGSGQPMANTPMGLGQCSIKIAGMSIRANGLMAKDTVSGHIFTIMMDIMSGNGKMDNVMAMERGPGKMDLVIMDNGHMTSVRAMRYSRTILEHSLEYSI